MGDVVANVGVTRGLLNVGFVHLSLLIHELESHLFQVVVLHLLIRKNLIIIIILQGMI